jgi:hypothetical protein
MTDRDQRSSDMPTRHSGLEERIQESDEARIRRCLHTAGALVAKAAAEPGRELMHLGGARAWIASALKGIDDLARIAEQSEAARETLPLRPDRLCEPRAAHRAEK